MRPEVELWWLQAQEDMETARHCAKGDRHYAAAFFCQQAAEKSLKAAFIHVRQANPGPTHSLVNLGTAVGVGEPMLGFLRELTPSFVATRYPDVSQDVPARLYDAVMVQRLLAGTTEVMEWVGKRLR